MEFTFQYHSSTKQMNFLPCILVSFFYGMMSELFYIPVYGIASILSLNMSAAAQAFLVCCVHCSICLMLN